MTVTTHTSFSDSRTIRGITYKVGNTFKCYASNNGALNSEGSGSAAALTVGETYTFKGYATDDDNGGALTSYPYLVGDSLGNTRGWYKENVFPYKTITLTYNANGGTGTLSSQSINWNSTFNLSNNTFKREGYKFVGWNVYRHSDSKWYVVSQGWMTEDEILANGYEKKIYENQSELTFNDSWVNDDEYSISEYTMYAVWEISGVVYIDNGTSFEPYLAYIDDGTNWNLYLMYVDDGTSWNIIS